MRRALGCALMLSLAGCDREPAAASIEFVAAPKGDAVEAIVERELSRAQSDQLVLLIYVGASWCEPCQRFHAAAERGEVKGLPKLRMVEFDRDADEERLKRAGCLSELIPLFARPTADGRCDQNRRVMGGIKGEGTVAFIAGRLQKMLAM